MKPSGNPSQNSPHAGNFLQEPFWKKKLFLEFAFDPFPYEKVTIDTEHPHSPVTTDPGTQQLHTLYTNLVQTN